MKKYTSGPWRISKTWLKMGVINIDSVHKVIVNHRCINQIIDEEDIANASLIAAAPELLEMCKELVSHLKGHDEGFYDLDVINRAEQAITKAEISDLEKKTVSEVK